MEKNERIIVELYRKKIKKEESHILIDNGDRCVLFNKNVNNEMYLIYIYMKNGYPVCEKIPVHKFDPDRIVKYATYLSCKVGSGKIAVKLTKPAISILGKSPGSYKEEMEVLLDLKLKNIDIKSAKTNGNLVSMILTANLDEKVEI